MFASFPVAWPGPYPGTRATLAPNLVVCDESCSLILDDLHWSEIWPGFAVVAAFGAVMLFLTVQMIKNYD